MDVLPDLVRNCLLAFAAAPSFCLCGPHALRLSPEIDLSPIASKMTHGDVWRARVTGCKIANWRPVDLEEDKARPACSDAFQTAEEPFAQFSCTRYIRHGISTHETVVLMDSFSVINLDIQLDSPEVPTLVGAWSKSLGHRQSSRILDATDTGSRTIRLFGRRNGGKVSLTVNVDSELRMRMIQSRMRLGRIEVKAWKDAVNKKEEEFTPKALQAKDPRMSAADLKSFSRPVQRLVGSLTSTTSQCEAAGAWCTRPPNAHP